MDLEENLKQTNSDLFSSLEDIKKSCAEIWKDRLLPWFTNHDCAHSEEIIHILDQILNPIEGHDQFLTDHELFILLASAYLHDIGMQFLKVDGLSIDSLTETEYEEIRRRHAEASYNIILKRIQPDLTRDDFHLPNIDEEYLPVIAKVSKGHSTDYFDSVVSEFQSDPSTPKGRKVRGELLTALLMIADELDLQAKREDFKEIAKFTPSSYSLVHWFKHHYVDYIEIKSGIVKITLRFPEGAETYPELIRESLKAKLSQQIERVNPILSRATGGLLHLEPIIEFEVKFDNTGLKRPLPADVLRELQTVMEEPTSRETGAPCPVYCTSLPKPSPIFTGRQGDIDKFKKAFDSATFISIEGLGGIGKTEFAAKCIEEFVPNERVVWLDCIPDSKLDLLIDCAGYPDVLKGESKTELAKYSGFTDLIERDRKVIFLDNFQDVIDPSFRAFFKFAERRLSKARIVLISREMPDAGVRIAPIPLDGLQEDAPQYARRLIDTYYSDVLISDDKLKVVCYNLQGHPFAIEFAVQLLRYGETSDNIIKKIVDAKGKSEELSRKLLDEVFNHPRSTDEERDVLVHFSVFRAEVDKAAISSLFDGRDVTETIRKLYDKKMIMRSQTGNLYSTHPLIREFCYQRLKNKSNTHLRAAEYLKTHEKDKLDASLEDEIFHQLFTGGHFDRAADLITGKGELFIRSGYTNALSEMITKVVLKNINRPEFEIFYGDIATIRGEWQHALGHFEKVFIFPNADARILAEAYIKYGEVLFRKGNVKEALKYFSDAYESSKHRYPREEARSLNDIGIVYDFLGDLKSAERDYKVALSMRLQIGDKDDIATSLNNIGMVLQEKGKLDDALNKYTESLHICEEIDSKEGIATSLNNIGRALNKKGKLDDALKKYTESLKIREEIGSKAGIATSLNNIGMVLQEKGKLDDALQKYSESFRIWEEIDSKDGIATSLNNIGMVLQEKGKLDDALKKYTESLKIHEEIDSKDGIATSLNNIGGVLQGKGKFDDALKKYTESLKIREEIGSKDDISNSLNNIGSVLQEKGKLDDALKKYTESLKIREEIGSKSYIANSLNNIGRVLKEKGKLDDALKKYTESLQIYEEIGSQDGIANCKHNIGALLFGRKEPRSSLEQLLVALALRNQMGTPEQATKDWILKIRRSAGLKEFRVLLNSAFEYIPTDLKPFINLADFQTDETVHRQGTKVGRNDPCPCGSGKKFKKCCGN